MGSIRSRSLRRSTCAQCAAQEYTKEQLGEMLAEMLEINTYQEDDIKILLAHLLLNLGADPNSVSPKGSTPLIAACRLTDAFKTVEGLLRHGASVDERNSMGKTALMEAADQCKPDLVDLLVQSGANTDARDNMGRTALIYAAKGRSVYHFGEVARLLVGSGADVNASDNQGQTALFRAIERGCPNTIEHLIRSGADVNHIAATGETPLIRLCSFNKNRHGWHFSIEDLRSFAQLLLDSGADIAAKDSSGMTALKWARKYRRSELVKVLLAAGA